MFPAFLNLSHYCHRVSTSFVQHVCSVFLCFLAFCPPFLSSPVLSSPALLCSHQHTHAHACTHVHTHNTTQHNTTQHITSHHITSHHITSHHVTSHHITSHLAFVWCSFWWLWRLITTKPSWSEAVWLERSEEARTRQGVVRKLLWCRRWVVDGHVQSESVSGCTHWWSFSTHRGNERFPGITITDALHQMVEKIAEKTDKAKIKTKARLKL